jgi:hypothetical protein
MDPERYQFRASWSAGHPEITPRVAVSMSRADMSQPLAGVASSTSAHAPSPDLASPTDVADDSSLVHMMNIGNMVLTTGFPVPR